MKRIAILVVDLCRHYVGPFLGLADCMLFHMVGQLRKPFSGRCRDRVLAYVSSMDFRMDVPIRHRLRDDMFGFPVRKNLCQRQPI